MSNEKNNYAIWVLQRELDFELRNLASANEITKGNGFYFDRATMQAFDTSKNIAKERIPVLTDAIKKLSENNGE